MEENTERENQQENAGKESEDDVDLYGDLEATGSDANLDVIDRFNKLFSPKNRIREDNFYEDEICDEEKEDDVGLYDDLNTFEKQLQAEELEAKVEMMEQKCASLAQQNTELKSELDKVNRMNFALKRNISSVFKTAKAELDRKERQLKELQREHDSLVFRRGGASKALPPAKPIEHIPNDCQILKKDSANGNLVMLEKETECTFQMGKVTISFAVESADFFKQRLNRLKSFSPPSEDITSTTKELKLNGSQLQPSEKRSETETNQCRNWNTREISSKSRIRKKDSAESKKDDREEKGVTAENLEEGEVLEDPLPPRHDSRGNSRSSRSPSSGNKRKRSPSADKRQHRFRDRLVGSHNRTPSSSSSNRLRLAPRSPVKSFSSSSRHRGNRGNVQSRPAPPPRGSDHR